MCVAATPGIACDAGNAIVSAMGLLTFPTRAGYLCPLVPGGAPSLQSKAIYFGHVIDRALWVLLRSDASSFMQASIAS
jgi:hypothetical protein